jgi:hypothetical protein
MSETAIGVDWANCETAAVKTTKAKENKTVLDGGVRVLCVPRARFSELCALPWESLERLAVSGDADVEPRVVLTIELAPKDRAFMREGLRSDGKLVGKSLLFRQGWDALS